MLNRQLILTHKLAGAKIVFLLIFGILFGSLNLSGCAGKSAEEWVQDLKSRDEAVRRHAALELLKKSKEEAVPPLIRAVRAGDEQLQYLSVQLLGKMRDPEATQVFLSLLESPSEHIRAAVAEALGNLKTPEGTDPLLHLLKDASPVV
ncbi:MAG: hypothetical protein DRP97_08330, partial [Candidatus Latescibacterota bacterium]